MQVTDEFFSWKDKPAGTNITGRVLSIGIHTWDDGKPCPQFVLEVDGEEVGLTVSQIGLKRLMAEQRPEVGDTISVTLTSVEPRPGGKTLKHYDLQVTRGGTQPAPKAAPAAAPAEAKPELTAEQAAAIAALKAQGVL